MKKTRINTDYSKTWEYFGWCRIVISLYCGARKGNREGEDGKKGIVIPPFNSLNSPT